MIPFLIATIIATFNKMGSDDRNTYVRNPNAVIAEAIVLFFGIYELEINFVKENIMSVSSG